MERTLDGITDQSGEGIRSVHSLGFFGSLLSDVLFDAVLLDTGLFENVHGRCQIFTSNQNLRISRTLIDDLGPDSSFCQQAQPFHGEAPIGPIQGQRFKGNRAHYWPFW